MEAVCHGVPAPFCSTVSVGTSHPFGGGNAGVLDDFTGKGEASRNKLLQITHNGLYPEFRRGDYVIWQEVRGFVQEGYYVVDSGGEPNIYLVQNCGGKLCLLWPERDIDPVTRKLKEGRKPQEVTPEKFSEFCLGFVVAGMKVHHSEALHQREVLKARSYTGVGGRKALA